MKGELYEMLFRENKRLKELEMRHNDYIRMWKERFGYNDSVSFDVVLADLLKTKSMWEEFINDTTVLQGMAGTVNLSTIMKMIIEIQGKYK